MAYVCIHKGFVNHKIHHYFSVERERGLLTVIQWLQGSSKHKNSLFTMVLMEALYSGKYTFKHYCYSVIFACKSLVNFSISRYWRGLLQTHFQIWLSLGVFSDFLGRDVSFYSDRGADQHKAGWENILASWEPTGLAGYFA